MVPNCFLFREVVQEHLRHLGHSGNILCKSLRFLNIETCFGVPNCFLIREHDNARCIRPKWSPKCKNLHETLLIDLHAISNLPCLHNQACTLLAQPFNSLSCLQSILYRLKQQVGGLSVPWQWKVNDCYFMTSVWPSVLGMLSVAMGNVRLSDIKSCGQLAQFYRNPLLAFFNVTNSAWNSISFLFRDKFNVQKN